MSDTILVPVTAVQPDLVTQTDVVVYVPLASKNAHGIVKIGDGLNITNDGELWWDASEVPIKHIAKNGEDIVPDDDKRVNIVLNKIDVGLSNVDNTSDLDKPISTLTKKALDNLEVGLSNSITDLSNSITDLSNNTQQSLDDLKTTLTDNIFDVSENLKLHIGNKDNPHEVTKAQVGLSNVDNTSDKNKPISDAAKQALDTKMDKSGGIFTGNVGVQGNLSVSGTITTKDTETLKVQDNVIVTNANKIELLDLSGLAINKNDTQTYGIMYDAVDDSVKLGLGSIDSAGKFTFNEGEGSPVATRSDSSSLTDNHLIKWDAINNKLVDSGYSADSFITLEHADDIYVPKKSNDTTRNAIISNGRGNISISSNQGELLSSAGYHSSLLRSTPFRSTFGSYYDKEEEDTNDGTIYDITYSGNVSCENTSTSAIVNIISSKYDDFSGDTDSYNTNINMTHTNMSLGSYLNYGDTNPNPYKKTIKNAEINLNNNGVQINTLQGLLLTYNDSEVVNMNKLDSTSIRYDIEQTLTDEQKAQARANIGAGTGSGTGGGTTVTVGGVAQDTWDADSKVNKNVDTYSINIDNSGIVLANSSDTVDYINLTTDKGIEIHHQDSNAKSDFKIQNVSVMATSEFTDSDAGVTYTAQNGIFQGMITIGSATSEQNTLMLLQPAGMEIGHTKGDSVHKILANENSIGIYDKCVVDGNTLQGVVNTFSGMAAIQASSNTSGSGIVVQPNTIEISTPKLTYNDNEVATTLYVDNLINDKANKKDVVLLTKEGTQNITSNIAISGDLNINGNIIQQGAAYETHAESVYTKNDYIITRDGAVSGLGNGEYTGIVAKLYDGINDGRLIFDSNGVARIGDIGDEQPLATREETPISDGFAKWDSNNNKFITKLLDVSDLTDSITLAKIEDVNKLLEDKVNKIEGKDLSTNDFTDDYKSQVENNTTARHTHNNKTILDETTASYTTDNALSVTFAESERQKSVSDGAITHNLDAPVVFAEKERQKSKNLFDLNYNGTFNSKTETSVSKYISLKSVYGEKFTINTNLPQYSFTRGSVGDIYTNIIFKNLKPNTSYTISFTPISVDNDVAVHFLGVYNVQDNLNTKVTKTITTDENGRFNTGYGIWINGQNTTFVVKDIQLEEGSVATDYQPYNGSITHNGDAPVVFAEKERQKSKNLFDLSDFDSNLTGYVSSTQTDQQITFTSTNPVAWFGYKVPVEIGKQYTISVSDISYTTEGLFVGNSDVRDEFSYGKLTTSIKTLTLTTNSNYLYIKGYATYNTVGDAFTINKLQIEEGSVATDYQPYNGAIVHEKDLNMPELLWQNDNTSREMSAQTLQLVREPSNYTKIRIVSKPMHWSDDETTIFDYAVKTGSIWCRICGQNIDGTENMFSTRILKFTFNSTVVYLSDCYQYNGTAMTTNNARGIPVAIYGIK